MTDGEPDGRAESVRRRLRNELQSRGEDVGLGLQRYVIERFLYRLGKSRHRSKFILKGATLFAMWGTAYRPTRDIDFTGYGSSDPQDVIDAIREICETQDDVGEIVFATDSITAEPIRDGSEYDGLRLKLRAHLGESVVTVQIDVGFGNAIVPGPQEEEFRTILGDPPPRILAYPAESVVAEKLHAMVILGERNSRMKDFYDVQALAREFRFERTTLVSAARATFERRATPLPGEIPAALTSAFYAQEERASRWRAYVTRNNLAHAPLDFDETGEAVISFLRPIWDNLAAGANPGGTWESGGPWSSAAEEDL
jgi:predicted nucleotidyltransferase component of viral defense system